MKFKGKPTGNFRDDPRWHSGGVEFTLDLTDDNGRHEIRCRVSREALSDLTGTAGSIGDLAVQRYRQHRDRIHDAVDRKLKRSDFESDGSILIRSHDLNG